MEFAPPVHGFILYASALAVTNSFLLASSSANLEISKLKANRCSLLMNSLFTRLCKIQVLKSVEIHKKVAAIGIEPNEMIYIEP